MNKKPKTTRVRAVYGKMFPSDEKFSSEYVELGMEVDVEVADTETFADASARVFGEVRASVDREVERIKTGREQPVGYRRHPDDVDYITVPAENVELLERQFGVKPSPQS